jgi:hypothetical protein
VTDAPAATGTAWVDNGKIYVLEGKPYTFKLTGTEHDKWYIGMKPTLDDGVSLNHDARNGSRDGAGPNSTFIYIDKNFNTGGAHLIAQIRYYLGPKFSEASMTPVPIEVYTPKVESVEADRDVVCVGDTVFTAILNSTSPEILEAMASCISWDVQQRNKSDDDWEDWTPLIIIGDPYTRLFSQLLYRDFRLRAKLGGSIAVSPIVRKVQLELKAVDTTTHGTNNVREAYAGETLYMVREEAFETQTANITATESRSYPFGSGEPLWSGQTAGLNGNTTVSFTGGAGDSATITAAAWDCSKAVGVSIVGKNEAAFTLFPGANKLADALESLSKKTAFPGGRSIKFGVDDPTLTGSRWTVEKPNSPETTHSYKGSFGIGGSLKGKITHPTFSGQFPPAVLPGEPWALWVLRAEL